MNERRQIFRRTQQRLALWYAGVMGAILAVGGVGFYEVVVHAHRMTLDREVRSVTKAIRASLEPLLVEPGVVSVEAQRLLPEYCDLKQCHNDRHADFDLTGRDYYAILHDHSGAIVATSGRGPDLPFHEDADWTWLTDDRGERFYQTALALKTREGKAWGRLYVGRSIRAWDRYLALVRWSLVLGLPVGWLAIGVASWWLAGRAMLPVRESYDRIQQFTADAAHELRTPLAAMVATIEAERVTSSTEETITMLDRLHDRARRLTELVRDLLRLSQLDRQDAPQQAERCDLAEIVADVVEEFSALAQRAEVTLAIEAVASAVVWGNEAQLYQVVANLLGNGIHHTPAGGAVRVILKLRDRGVRLLVEDTGMGVPTELRSRIFERFYQVKADRGAAGAGLGLAIVAAIVQLHGGSVACLAAETSGAVFVVDLPRGDRAS